MAGARAEVLINEKDRLAAVDLVILEEAVFCQRPPDKAP